MNPTRVAVFGAGNMGRNHLRVLSARSDVAIVAVADPMYSADTKALAPRAMWFEVAGEAFDMEFDVGVVAAPTETHFEIVWELLERGKHVLVEKPAATTEAQCRQLVQMAQTKKRVLAVGNIERMNPAVAMTDDLVRFGRLGALTHFEFKRAGAYPPRIQPGNNVCLDLAVHDFDVLSLLCGSATVNQVTTAAVKQPGIIDIFDASLRTKEAFGHISADWYSPERKREAQFIFRRGNVVMSYLDQSVTAYLPKDLWPELSEDRGDLVAFFGLKADVTAKLESFNDKCLKLSLHAPKINALDAQWLEFKKLLHGDTSRLATQEQLIASVALAENALAMQHVMALSLTTDGTTR